MGKDPEGSRVKQEYFTTETLFRPSPTSAPLGDALSGVAHMWAVILMSELVGALLGL